MFGISSLSSAPFAALAGINYYTFVNEPQTLVDSIYASGWFAIPDGQTPNWNPVSNTQSTTWVAVNDGQSSNWTLISNT